MEIEVMTWDRHTQVVGLKRLMVSGADPGGGGGGGGRTRRAPP